MPAPIKNNACQSVQKKSWAKPQAEAKQKELTGLIKGREVKLKPARSEQNDKKDENHKINLKAQKKLEREVAKYEERMSKLPAFFLDAEHTTSEVHEDQLGKGTSATVDQRIKLESKSDFFQRQGFPADYYQDLKGGVGHFFAEKKVEDVVDDLKGDVMIYKHFPEHPNIMKLISAQPSLKQAVFEHGGVDLCSLINEREIKAATKQLKELREKHTKCSDRKEQFLIELERKKVRGEIARLSADAKSLPSLVMLVMESASAGLRHLHQHDIMHRDIKLENILIDAKGQVRLGDLGLAIKTTDDNPELAGTPAYLPPESVTWYLHESSFKPDLGQTTLGKIWARYAKERLDVMRFKVNPDWVQTTAGDMWALGAIGLDLLHGERVAVEKRHNVLKGLQYRIKVEEEHLKSHGVPLSIELRCKKALAFDLIPGLLEADPSKRLSSEELVDVVKGFYAELDDLNTSSLPDYLR